MGQYRNIVNPGGASIYFFTMPTKHQVISMFQEHPGHRAYENGLGSNTPTILHTIKFLQNNYL